ncbi:TRAP transporter large permease subunit [Schinkia azotoformans]|uniref:C4-dicarboxylate ABC transporter permease n=1 Tax=Schinkia azotoformans LMG 9581 TaxID=1131731 RepID=K6C9U5_SCHAZ|nr:TRAP transporter large permease subunit [Schinkia azotoformans]EKN67905.1 C4-dicarboxylate ABC transporter permease [Schinkia azotoformans LMG 9581]MEC1637075.1 TRAP transporter large permease subunit [Schinkia azotoformans]MEC1719899.1 TRAP transporter large permease subunit [Schinkia azotoformans]MEC1945480.1 TRAP transporter large permease subunit [Schinkia azotoformans]MED4351324.1 TRAP transporter large permease subunit [Schinkia azotoformans]
MATILLFSSFAILLLLRVPIAVSLIAATTFVFWMDGSFSMWTIPQKIFTSMNSVTLMAIPGFVLAGTIIAKGGIAKYLIECLRSWIGHVSGGLSVVTIVACMFFAAISGSSPATAAAIGSIMIPAMVNAGYSKRYAMGLVASAGTLGILIPPSIPLIVYGVVTEQSIGALFMAGVIPGIGLTICLIIYAIIYARIKGYGKLEKASWSERISSSKKAIWGAFLPVLILGCIYSGATTPTEASIVSSVYAVIISLFVYKERSLQKWKEILNESIGITAMIMLIIAGAMTFSLFMTQEQIPQALAAKMMAMESLDVVLFFVLTAILFFILGMFLESSSIMLITLPLLLPIMITLGINPIHFAIVMIINMEIAQITPPVGLNLFVIGGIAKSKLDEVFKGAFPFIIVMIIYMIIVMAFPELSLWLPNRSV